MASSQPDLHGMKFGKLTVVSHQIRRRLKSGKSRIWYECVCDCGGTKVVLASRLRRNITTHCGCLFSAMNPNSLSYPKEMKPGEAGLNRLYKYVYLTNAKMSDREFSIDIETFRILTSSDCFYCGSPPSKVMNRSKKNTYGAYLYNGLDRIDSSKGYTLDNVVRCCTDCNRGKMDLTREEFFSLVKRIYEKHELGELVV